MAKPTAMTLLFLMVSVIQGFGKGSPEQFWLKVSQEVTVREFPPVVQWLKHLALSLKWLGSLLRCRLDSWPGAVG